MLGRRLRAMLALAPARCRRGVPDAGPRVHRAEGARRGRVALLAGCAQQVLAPAINEATIRLLTRMGVEVVVRPRAGCCGALTHHMGQHDPAMASRPRQHRRLDAARSDGEGLDAIVVNTSGCGTTVKDYGFMFRNEPEPGGARRSASPASPADVSASSWSASATRRRARSRG